MPHITVQTISGDSFTTGASTGWQIIHIYRGKHCPLCRQFLTELNASLEEFTAVGVDFIAISADTQDRAVAQVAEEGWKFTVGYGLTKEQMHTLGVYSTTPLPTEDVDHEFAEPAFFIVNPEGMMHVISLTTAPSAVERVRGALVTPPYKMTEPSSAASIR
jgi:peroxiredoxin